MKTWICSVWSLRLVRPAAFFVLVFSALTVFFSTDQPANAENGVSRPKHPFSQIKIPASARYCSFSGHAHEFEELLPLSVSEGMTVSAEKTLIARIQDYSGVTTKLQVYSGNALNAAAVLYPDDKDPETLRRAIVFQPYFLSYLEQRTRVAGQRSVWAKTSVFAHEVGHHLAGHTLRPENQRHNELQADWYSGFILGKMGADEMSAQIVLKTFWFGASRTHPASPDRLAAVTDGWRQARCEQGDRRDCERTMTEFAIDEAEQRKTDEEAKEDERRVKVPPRLMCQIGGEPMAVGTNNKVYWLRHYETQLKAVGTATRASSSQASAAASGDACGNSMQVRIADGMTIEFCDDEKIASSPARVISEQNRSQAPAITGVCERCSGDKDSLCPPYL